MKSAPKQCNQEETAITCPVTCEKCEECADSKYDFRIRIGDEIENVSCEWVKEDIVNRCQLDEVPSACRATCEQC